MLSAEEESVEEESAEWEETAELRVLSGCGRILRMDDDSPSDKKNREPVSRFEDLIAWQKARELTRLIYQSTKQGNFSRDFALRDQIRRAAVSVMSNIAEGFERARPGEFKQYLSIAKGSCGEVRSQLYVALDAGYLQDGTFQALHELADEVARIIGGLRAAVARKAKNKTGST